MINGNGNANGNGSRGMSDWNIKSITPMPSPGDLKKKYPMSPEVFKKIVEPSRLTIQDIIIGEDKRLLVIVGPCAVFNVEETLEYAEKLTALSCEVSERLFLVMRACMDKPRTGLGWPGFFQDPDMNYSYNIQDGWAKGRKLLVDIVTMGMPVAMELLDADACQNIDACVSYWWLGARTVTSQRLRQIASGLSTPVGFKNPTDGNLKDAIEAIETAWHDSAFISSNQSGIRCEYRTTGNKHGHLILRGTKDGPNFDSLFVTQAAHELAQRGLPTRVLIDASHGNSGKDFRKQKDVIANITSRVLSGDKHVAGFLYESYLEAGNQKLPKDLSELKPRISVTDGCEDWETTREVLLHCCDSLSKIPSV